MRRLVTFFLVIPLLGALTAPAAAQSPPTTAEELLAGMVTEEVEPGVFRVVNDGVRDLRQPSTGLAFAEAVFVDGNGHVWRVIHERDGRPASYFRLGAEGERFDGDPIDLAAAGLYVKAAPDGGLMTFESALADLRERTSATTATFDLDIGVPDIAVQDDGTVWLLDRHVGGLMRVPPDGEPDAARWTDVYDGRIEGFAVTPQGEAWLMGAPWEPPNHIEVFLRFEGTDWEVVPAPDELAFMGHGIGLDVGPDGTLWAVGDSASPHRGLARYDGSWTVFEEGDGVRPWGSQRVGVYGAPADMLRVAPDASVWMNEWGPDRGGCGGLGRFDIRAWSSFLPGMCVLHFDFAPDGAVWVVAQDERSLVGEPGGSGVQTYVITPEAVEAKKAEASEPSSVEATSEAEEAAPVTTEELLSGMVTEEVEPGVLRVINDSVRDLGSRHHLPDLAEAVLVDDSGDVWRVMPDRDDWSATYFRLGAEEERQIEPGTPESEELGLAAITAKVAPDGRLSVGGSEVQRFIDEGSLTPEHLRSLGAYGAEVEFEDGGTVWLLDQWGGLVRMRPDATPEVMDWQSAYDGEVVGPLSVTAGGEAWLMGRPATNEDRIEVFLIDAFLHFDGSDWEVVPAPEGLARGGSLSIAFDVAPDGTLWTVGDSSTPHGGLARYDGSDWTTFGEAEGVRPWGGHRVGVYAAPVDMLRVAPDSSVWVNAAGPGDWGCDGLGRYDGQSWSSYLLGMCVSDYDFAPDGAVWVVATETPVNLHEGTGVEIDTYVITPEAVAGTE